MRLLVCIPVVNQWEFGRISLGQWDWMTSLGTDFLLLDNGSTCNWQEWLQKACLKDRGRWEYVRNEQNVGLLRSSQQAYEYAVAHGYDLLAIAHNDVWVWLNNWDVEMQQVFFKIENVGACGFFGSKGCNRDGLRRERVVIDTLGERTGTEE